VAANLKKLFSLGRVESAYSLLRLSPIGRQTWRTRLTYLPPAKLRVIEREADRISRQGVAGDFAEFGVALGGSGIVMASKAAGQRSYHGFDVFGMIPPPENEKDGEKSKERYQVIVSGKSQGIGGEEYYGYRDDLITAVKNSFAQFKVPVDGKNVFLHKGLFEDTWEEASRSINALALVHIDCDWYDPVQFSLARSDSKLSVGGAIILDDYFAYEGARSATDEFLAAHPNYQAERRAPHMIIRKVSSGV
jgi:asparagine synthase (glutamine-hydrolysing)